MLRIAGIGLARIVPASAEGKTGHEHDGNRRAHAQCDPSAGETPLHVNPRYLPSRVTPLEGDQTQDTSTSPYLEEPCRRAISINPSQASAIVPG